MHKIVNLIIAVMMAWLGFAACSSDEEEVKGDVLQVSPTSISVSEAAQEAEVTISSSAAPKVTINDHSWCSITQSSKGKNNGLEVTALALKIAENTTNVERKATITVLCGPKAQTVSVTQAAKPLPDPDSEVPAASSVAFARSMALGWNLGNQMDAYNSGVAGETAWGNKKCTQATMNAIKAAGITTVRIPVTWLGKFGAAPDYKINADWLNRVAEIVGYAKKAGLKAIINIHHDGADSQHWLNIKEAAKSADKNAEICAQVKALWTQIANKFKDEGEYLVFEGFNEIHDGGWGWGDNRSDGGKQYAALASWNQTFVDAVRATGGQNATRYLGIAAYCTNINIACFGDPWNTDGKGTRMALPTDPATDRLLVSVHNYDLSDYTLTAKYSEWGHTSSQKETKDREKEVASDFKKLKTSFADKGIGVYVGEFGCVNRASNQERAFQIYFLEYYCKLAHDYGIPCVLWDNGSTKTGNECHGYFDHGDGHYIGYAEVPVKAMVNAWTNEDSSYTLQSIYDNAPQ